MEIGIIGHGVVGSALHAGFEKLNLAQHLTIFDPLTHPGSVSFKNAPFVFICVPTPMYDADGSQNISAVANALNALSDEKYEGIVVLKSTITPTNVSALLGRYDDLHIIANPEFLTERSAVEDFEKQPFIVIGGDEGCALRLAALYRKHWINSDIRWLPSAAAAMMVKYMLNCFYATKVTFLNECFTLWQEIGDADWEHVVAGFRADDRVSSSHTHVPGPDGKLGFGGKCFPKDLNALISIADDAGVPHHVLEGVRRTNKAVRRQEPGR